MLVTSDSLLATFFPLLVTFFSLFNVRCLLLFAQYLTLCSWLKYLHPLHFPDKTEG